MKLNELRIGNIVKILGQETVIEGFCTWDNIVQSNNFSERPIEEFEGIPITEEWVKKFGFKSLLDDPELTGELSENGEYIIIKNKYCSFDILFGFTEDDSILMLFNDCYFDSIKFVHHLQNFYFALTGEELTLQNINNKQTNK